MKEVHNIFRDQNLYMMGFSALQLLGRADNVRDFVRRGEREGFVQIWLKTGQPSPQHEVIIKRSLDAKENKSEWRINGDFRTSTAVESKICLLLL